MQPEWQGSASEYLAQQGGQGAPQQGGGGTLGATAEAMQGGGGGSPVEGRFAQALQMMNQVYAPLIRPPAQQQHGIGWHIGNALTFGMQGLYERDYTNAYNARIEEQNQKVRAKAVEDALGYVGDQMQLESLGSKQMLSQLHLQARLLGLEETMRNNEFNRLVKVTQPNRPLTEDEQAGAAQQGLVREPVPGMEGRTRWVPRYAPPAEGTELSQKLAGSGGGTVGSAAAPPQSYEELRRRRAAETAAAKPLDAEGQKIVGGLKQMRGLIRRALSEFTPEERRQFVGVFRNPANRAAQIVKGNPRFQEWQALVGQMQEYKFAKGGANLTAQEIATVEQFLPTGKEWGGGDEFEVKAKEFYRSSLGHIRQRLGASQSRGQLREGIEQEAAEPGATEVPGASVPADRKTRRLSSGKLIVEE